MRYQVAIVRMVSRSKEKGSLINLKLSAHDDNNDDNNNDDNNYHNDDGFGRRFAFRVLLTRFRVRFY